MSSSLFQQALHGAAVNAGITVMNECGVDPGNYIKKLYCTTYLPFLNCLFCGCITQMFFIYLFLFQILIQYPLFFDPAVMEF
jgi:hypothetical protein